MFELVEKRREEKRREGNSHCQAFKYIEILLFLITFRKKFCGIPNRRV